MLAKQQRSTAMFLQIEQFGDLESVCMADKHIVEQLIAKKQSGELRLNFLVNRFEKDIVKLVKNVLTISAAIKKSTQPRQVRIDESMSKIEFRELWEHLKVC